MTIRRGVRLALALALIPFAVGAGTPGGAHAAGSPVHLVSIYWIDATVWQDGDLLDGRGEFGTLSTWTTPTAFTGTAALGLQSPKLGAVWLPAIQDLADGPTTYSAKPNAKNFHVAPGTKIVIRGAVTEYDSDPQHVTVATGQEPVTAPAAGTYQLFDLTVASGSGPHGSIRVDLRGLIFTSAKPY